MRTQPPPVEPRQTMPTCCSKLPPMENSIPYRAHADGTPMTSSSLIRRVSQALSFAANWILPAAQLQFPGLNHTRHLFCD